MSGYGFSERISGGVLIRTVFSCLSDRLIAANDSVSRSHHLNLGCCCLLAKVSEVGGRVGVWTNETLRSLFIVDLLCYRMSSRKSIPSFAAQNRSVNRDWYGFGCFLE